MRAAGAVKHRGSSETSAAVIRRRANAGPYPASSFNPGFIFTGGPAIVFELLSQSRRRSRLQPRIEYKLPSGEGGRVESCAGAAAAPW